MARLESKPESDKEQSGDDAKKGHGEARIKSQKAIGRSRRRMQRRDMARQELKARK